MLRELREVLVWWWNMPFDYHWTVRHLRERGVIRVYRFFVALTSTLYGFTSLGLVWWGVSTPGSVHHLWFCGLGAVVSVLIAVLWIFAPWPSETVSVMFVVFINASVVLVTLTCTNAYNAMPGLALLASNGIYVMLLHGPRALMLHLLYTAAALGGWVALVVHQGHTDLAVLIVRLLVLVPTALGQPIVVQIFLMTLRMGATDARHDPLTRLLNRRGLELDIAALMRDRPGMIAVLAVDIDKFKSINDTYGHHAGDRVLTAVADAVRDAVQAANVESVAARTGGEEFLVFIRGTAADGLRVAGALHAGLERCPGEVTPTVSIGVAAVACAAGRTDAAVRAAGALADAAMYDAKHAGGARTVLAGQRSADGIEYSRD